MRHRALYSNLGAASIQKMATQHIPFFHMPCGSFLIDACDTKDFRYNPLRMLRRDDSSFVFLVLNLISNM